MSKIYKITNIINQKSYIGKTNHSIEKRFEEHKRDSRKQRCEKRPLYAAMNKYGFDNFVIEELVECHDSEAAELEMYFIEKYKTYGSTGYNATRGGDSKSYIDYDQAEKLYRELGTITAVAKEMGHDSGQISTGLKARGVKVDLQPIPKDSWTVNPIEVISSNGERMYFDEGREFIDYIINNSLTTATIASIRGSIKRALDKKRSRYLGFIVNYVKERD